MLGDKGLCEGLVDKGDGVLLFVSKVIGESGIGRSIMGDGITIGAVGLEC